MTNESFEFAEDGKYGEGGFVGEGKESSKHSLSIPSSSS